MDPKILETELNELESLISSCKKEINNIPLVQENLESLICKAGSLKKELNTKKTVVKDYPDFSGMNILIVDDNNINVMVAEAFLKKTGCNITTADNGKTALEKIEQSMDNPFHLVLMDMLMPVMNGSDAVHELRRKNPENYPGNLKVIAITGNIVSDENEILKEGFNDYLSKPLASELLYEKCNLLLKSEIPFNKVLRTESSEIKISSTPKKTYVSNYPDLSGKNILVVDDNKLNVEIINLMVKKTNASFENAFDGQDALEKFLNSNENHYDLVLMDIQMPLMDGNTCAMKIRSSGRKDKDIPIIAISANAFQEDKEKSLKAGINFHMSKPVNMKALHDKMVEML